MLTEQEIAGMVLICRAPCSSCPFIPGPGAIKLARGRLADIARRTKVSGTFPCHKAARQHGHDVLCAGWDAKVRPSATRMAERFRILREVSLDELPPRTKEQIAALLAEHDGNEEE